MADVAPRWQRTIVPSVIAAVDALRGDNDTPPQLLIATHAPLVLASVEPLFSQDLDELFHLQVVDGKVVLETAGAVERQQQATARKAADAKRSQTSKLGTGKKKRT